MSDIDLNNVLRRLVGGIDSDELPGYITGAEGSIPDEISERVQLIVKRRGTLSDKPCVLDELLDCHCFLYGLDAVTYELIGTRGSSSDLEDDAYEEKRRYQLVPASPNLWLPSITRHHVIGMRSSIEADELFDKACGWTWILRVLTPRKHRPVATGALERIRGEWKP